MVKKSFVWTDEELSYNLIKNERTKRIVAICVLLGLEATRFHYVAIQLNTATSQKWPIKDPGM